MTPESRSIDSQPPTSSQDPALYRMLIIGLVLVVLSVVVGGIVLAGMGKQMPGEIIALGGVCAGALASMLVPTSAR